MKRFKKVLFLSLAVVALAACGSNPAANMEESSSKAENSSESTDQKAKSDTGEFTLYTSQPEEDVAKLVETFNEEYPDIKVNVFRSGTEEVISKVLAEKQTGKIQADALLVSDSFTFENLAEEDLLQPYESKELAEIPEEYVDDENLYTGTKLIVTGLAVNTDMVDANDIKGFADMTDKQVKGQTMIPSPLYSGAASLNLSILTQQEKIGWDFYEALKDNEVFVGQGNGTVRDALINGEQGIGMLVDYMANRAKQDGAPIEFVYPEEGALYVTEPIGIIKDTANAAPAETFVDFVLSKEGQTAASKMGYTPVRQGVAAPEGLKGVEDIDPMPFDESKVLENRDADKEKFAELFGQN
ncbi:ABC transporter substrate-binding protein [Candidatus Enterococcus ferrettii]|uniref:Iron(III) transport system substrate-binding protein n=1 Tax=Candidatus Enterococcus ferrettii TaxID=2815324 RepID=A0ABV0EN75_9ENTE